jgi:hypothetical protein
MGVVSDEVRVCQNLSQGKVLPEEPFAMILYL